MEKTSVNYVLAEMRSAQPAKWEEARFRLCEAKAAPDAPPRTLILGMPHLSLKGLSETWLMKECGHRHWLMIAAAAGRDVPDFRDADGEPVYAAFCAAAIRGAKFGALGENDELSFTSDLSRISGAQFVSLHKLSCNGRAAGEVELVSVFVKRRERGRNRSIARVALEGMPPIEKRKGFDRAAGVAAMIRADRWSEHFGFEKAKASSKARLQMRPCPSQDFNGAGFLYFAAFQAMADRAEWELLNDAVADYTTVERDIVYHGNIEPGERVAIRLLGQRDEENGLSHWLQIERDDDGAKLADVFTRRERCA